MNQNQITDTAYGKPQLTRFGTFRELTLLGPDPGNDIITVTGIGCNARDTDPDSPFACARS